MPGGGRISSKLERDDWEAMRAAVRRRADEAAELVKDADIGSEEFIVGTAALRVAHKELEEFDAVEPPA